jgi:hypothetical protein
MTAFLFLWLAFSARVELVNKVFDIPAREWRYWDRPLAEEPALIACEFSSTSPGALVRVALVQRDQLDAWLAGRDHDEIAATAAGQSGSLRLALHDPNVYVVIDNRGARPASVRLGVFLEQPQVRTLSRGRQLAVIVISFGVFFLAGSLSAMKLLKAIRR